MRLLMSQNIGDNITVKWDEIYSYSQDCFTKAINHIEWQKHIKEHQTQEQTHRHQKCKDSIQTMSKLVKLRKKGKKMSDE